MRICLLGETYGTMDEGMRITTINLYQGLGKNHIKVLDLRDLNNIRFWRELKDFNPDIIHYIHGISLKSFLLAKLISKYLKDSKVIISALRSDIPDIALPYMKHLKPNLILAQSLEAENFFRNQGFKVKFFPSGVDTDIFKPVTKENKEKIRDSFGLNKDTYIILHIGSIKKGRNIKGLTELQRAGQQVLIVGPTSAGFDPEVYRHIARAGCLVWIKYIKDISQIYALSDCYVYPTKETRDAFGRPSATSIEMPLTVLEAMACNLPVVTTRFGALSRSFDEGDGLFFVNRVEEMRQTIEKAKLVSSIQNRRKVMKYSWKTIINDLEKIYVELLC